MKDELPVIEKIINSLKRDQEEVRKIENTIQEITLEVKKNNDELIRVSKENNGGNIFANYSKRRESGAQDKLTSVLSDAQRRLFSLKKIVERKLSHTENEILAEYMHTKMKDVYFSAYHISDEFAFLTWFYEEELAETQVIQYLNECEFIIHQEDLGEQDIQKDLKEHLKFVFREMNKDRDSDESFVGQYIRTTINDKVEEIKAYAERLNRLSFGQWLEIERRKQGLSLAELGAKSDLSASYLSRLEKNTRGIPTVDILRQLSRGLNIPFYQALSHATEESDGVPSFSELIENNEFKFRESTASISERNGIISLISHIEKIPKGELHMHDVMELLKIIAEL